MKKLKLIKRGAVAAKVASAGSTRTGAKVEKVKAGKKGAGAATAGRFTGVTSGMSVTKYQNATILGNLKTKLSDEELAADWKREFPNAKADYTEGTVRGVRSLVNKGKHGNDAPSRPIPQFIDGVAQPFWGERAAAKREAAEAKPVKGAAKKVIKKVAKK